MKAAALQVGVHVILAVIFPEADRAELEACALAERPMPAARAGVSVRGHPVRFRMPRWRRPTS